MTVQVCFSLTIALLTVLVHVDGACCYHMLGCHCFLGVLDLVVAIVWFKQPRLPTQDKAKGRDEKM